MWRTYYFEAPLYSSVDKSAKGDRPPRLPETSACAETHVQRPAMDAQVTMSARRKGHEVDALPQLMGSLGTRLTCCHGVQLRRSVHERIFMPQRANEGCPG